MWYIEEIIYELGSKLKWKDLQKINILSTKHHEIVKKSSWYNFFIYVGEKKFELILKYNFKNIHVNYQITDDEIKELKNCHKLILWDCNKITDIGIKELKNCH